ncbi:hydrogenase maturation peptidase HycI [Elusimicrobiota bacterium]
MQKQSQELNLKKILRKSLTNAKKIAILSIGSELRADDVAGVLVGRKLEELCKKQIKSKKLKIFHGENSPENLTGEIKQYKPTHLIIIDAADTSAEPGTIDIIDVEQVGGISFTTHLLPIKVMIDYLLQSFKCRVTVLGIQPKSIQFGKSPSNEVLESVDQISQSIKEIIE